MSTTPDSVVHWVGDAPTSFHGNGAASFAQTTRDRAQVTCSLCLTLLATTPDSTPAETEREALDLPDMEALLRLIKTCAPGVSVEDRSAITDALLAAGWSRSSVASGPRGSSPSNDSHDQPADHADDERDRKREREGERVGQASNQGHGDGDSQNQQTVSAQVTHRDRVVRLDHDAEATGPEGSPRPATEASAALVPPVPGDEPGHGEECGETEPHWQAGAISGCNGGDQHGDTVEDAPTARPATVSEVDAACEVMHDAYEAAAVAEGWETQERSRVPWSEVPEANKATMRAAVSALLAHLAPQPEAEVRADERERVAQRIEAHGLKSQMQPDYDMGMAYAAAIARTAPAHDGSEGGDGRG